MARKPCNGCGKEKEPSVGERAHFCLLCKKSPLNRTLLLVGVCRNGHPREENTFWEGAKHRCRACEQARTQANWSDPEKRLKGQDTCRQYRLRVDFGLTKDEWLAMYEAQNGLCFICGKKLQRWLDETGVKAAVDHCHRTGLLRGLLCRFPCNYYLGHFRDDPKLLRNCANYLENPPANGAFGKPRYTAPGKIGTKKRRKLMAESRLLTD